MQLTTEAGRCAALGGGAGVRQRVHEARACGIHCSAPESTRELIISPPPAEAPAPLPAGARSHLISRRKAMTWCSSGSCGGGSGRRVAVHVAGGASSPRSEHTSECQALAAGTRSERAKTQSSRRDRPEERWAASPHGRPHLLAHTLAKEPRVSLDGDEAEPVGEHLVLNHRGVVQDKHLPGDGGVSPPASVLPRGGAAIGRRRWRRRR